VSSRISPRRFSASHWARVLWFFGVCALLSLSWPLNAAEVPNWRSELPTLIRGLQESDKLLTQLETIWPTLSQKADEIGKQLDRAQKQLDGLKTELTTWQQNSEEWENSSSVLGQTLIRVQTLLAESMKRYEALSQSWSAYKQTVEKQVADLERGVKFWRTVAIAGGIGALAVGFLIGVLVGR
jgi:chromosome segregation ATPase